MMTETPAETLARLAEIRERAKWAAAPMCSNTDLMRSVIARDIPALLALVEWQRGEIERRNDLLREANAHCGGYGHTEDCKWATTGTCDCNVHTLRQRIEEATR